MDQRAYNARTGEFHDNDFAEVGAYLESIGKHSFTVPNIQQSASYRVAAGAAVVVHYFSAKMRRLNLRNASMRAEAALWRWQPIFWMPRNDDRW